MIPLRDNIPSRTFPIVNLLLVALNVAAFLYELSLGRQLERYLFAFGLVPAKYALPGLFTELGPGLYVLPFFTSMFLHGGWMHIISNMWILLIFGDNVEDRMGHLRYLFFYLLSGLAAALTQLWVSWGSPVPTIGASGAIAGVMGAYFILFPTARVLCLVPIFFFLQRIELPAFVFLGLWFWSQFHAGTMALAGAGASHGVAWWAHIGGFVGGILLLGLVLRPRRA